MLKTARWLATILLLAIIGGSIFSIVFQDVDSPLAVATSARMQTEQKRTGVRKDIWLATDKDRLHYRITAPSSMLLAMPKQSGYEVVEMLERMECLLQESIKNDTQQLRYIKAIEGEYRYATHEFLANSVFLSLSTAPGRDLPEHPPQDVFMKGLAKHVSLTLAGNDPGFHAEAFKALIRPVIGSHDS